MTNSRIKIPYEKILEIIALRKRYNDARLRKTADEFRELNQQIEKDCKEKGISEIYLHMPESLFKQWAERAPAEELIS